MELWRGDYRCRYLAETSYIALWSHAKRASTLVPSIRSELSSRIRLHHIASLTDQRPNYIRSCALASQNFIWNAVRRAQKCSEYNFIFCSLRRIYNCSCADAVRSIQI